MFEVGEYIIYGSNGVCQVEEIGPLNMPGAAGKRLYYTLVPVHTKGSKVFTPTDNEKVIMRPVMTKDAANDLINRIEQIEVLWVPDEKQRENTYKQTLRTCDYVDWVKIIKTLYLRRQSREAEGKKVTTSDEKYLKIAEDNLYGELAVALKIERDEVVKFITERVESLK